VLRRYAQNRLRFRLFAKVAFDIVALGSFACSVRADIPAEHAVNPAKANVRAERLSPATSALASWPFAIADFDGDSLPDLATVTVGQMSASQTRYWIRLQLSSGARQAIGITAPSGGLHLASRDVNGDSFPDLVVMALWERHPVAVLLNDGHGNFTLNEPSSFGALCWESRRNCTAAAVDTKEAAAAILATGTPGEHEAHSSPFALWHESKLFASHENLRAHLFWATFVFGRAPPCIPHN
jgi:hypothetical protein